MRRKAEKKTNSNARSSCNHSCKTNKKKIISKIFITKKKLSALSANKKKRKSNRLINCVSVTKKKLIKDRCKDKNTKKKLNNF